MYPRWFQLTISLLNVIVRRGELVDETNSIPKTWPLASAVAERLWNNDVSDDIPLTRKRLEQHRCRMVSRDIPASPIGPGTCSFS